MLNVKSDDLFRQIAFQYVDALGRELNDELAAMEADPRLSLVLPGLDRRVLGEVRARKRRRALRIAGALAACLLLVLLIPRMLDSDSSLSTAPQGAPSAGETMDAAPALPEMAEAEIAAEEPAAVEEGDSGALMGGGGKAYATIPLSFALPENLSVIRVEQDNEQSVYYLSDVNWDDVVLTLEESEEAPDTEGLAVYRLGERIAYGSDSPDYKLLTFTQEGIRYEMTCKYSMDTLVALWKQIV